MVGVLCLDGKGGTYLAGTLTQGSRGISTGTLPAALACHLVYCPCGARASNKVFSVPVRVTSLDSIYLLYQSRAA